MAEWQRVGGDGPTEAWQTHDHHGKYEDVSRITVQKGTVAVDFDGVIGQYSGDPQVPPQAPIPGAAEAIRRLKEQGHWIIIFSSRRADIIEHFLDRHGIPYDDLVAGPDKKPIYRVLVDDRAITFDGNWADAVRQIQSFQPYWRRH